MAEQNSTNNTQGLRKVKKIKRPVNRMMPGGPQSGTAQSSAAPAGGQNRPSSAPQPQKIISTANLDELLDNQLNLPALNAAKNNARNDESQNNYRRPDRFISEDDFAPKPRFLDTLMEGNLFTLKGIVLASVLAFVVGIMVTKLFSGGKTVVKDGLQGVVVNAEVPRGRARCGVADRTQGCVLYIMNPQRQDLQGRDFYDLASQLTGRQRFVVETGNMRYSSVKVRPGDIAQINIPPL